MSHDIGDKMVDLDVTVPQRLFEELDELAEFKPTDRSSSARFCAIPPSRS